MRAPSPSPAPGRGPWQAEVPPAGFVPFPDDAVTGSVADRLFAVAARRVDHTALSSPAGAWTYAELDDEVRGLATGLLAFLGADEPTPIGVVAAHDGPLVLAVLAVIAAGHIVVVLDPEAPAAQTAHVLSECAPPMVLHDAVHTDWVAERLRGADAPLAVPLDGLASATDPPVELPTRTADDPAMLAFTSGTSGSSKAAVVTHGVLLNLVRGATNTLGIGPHDRLPMLFPISLAVAAYPLFLPLLNGGTLTTLDVRSVGLEPVGPFLERERITVAYLAPTVVRFLAGSLGGRRFPDLRLVALGGEVVDREVLRLAADLFSPAWLANGYGTTETGVVTLWVTGAGDVGEGDEAVPVGYPVPDVEITVLDDTGAPVPAGTSGEIAVSSPWLFGGYWRHPVLTRRVLSRDERERPGWQTYRTGDLGSLDEHGALSVRGRLDTRVKVRGRSVVVGDVEASVQQLDAVADAAVVAESRDGVVELTAFVVLAGGEAGADATRLRAALLEHHEPYRVPSRWVLLGRLPRLPNGKLDRRALAFLERPAGAGPSAADPCLPDGPGSGTGGDRPELVTMRHELVDLWSRLLPGRSVGLDDDFVELGGDSLLSARMVLMIEREQGVTVPMGELVHARTVRRLAEVVVHRRASLDDGSTVACVAPGDGTARPRLWFVHDLHGSAYRVRHLARELGPDQPVWSFESPLLGGEPNRYRSLDTFAARYVTDLRRAQPAGPYWLAGYSFGGICAYEMARQLRQDGEEVAFLGIVDVGPGYRGPGWRAHRSPLRPWFLIPHPPPPGTPVRGWARHYGTMLHRTPLGAARHLMVRSGLVRLVDPVRFRRDLRRDGRVRPSLRLWYAWEEHWKLAARRWDRLSSYPGRVHLFWGSGSGSADGTMGWEPLVDDLVIERFTGGHLGILEPDGAAALAVVLRQALDREAAGAGPDRVDATDGVDLTDVVDVTDASTAAAPSVTADRSRRTP